MTERRAFLWGLGSFPAATMGFDETIIRAKELKNPTLKPVLYYVWIFSAAHEDYIPIGVFNSREEADLILKDIKSKAKKQSSMSSGAVLELNWDEFVSMATTLRLGKLAEVLEKLGIKVSA